MHRDYAESVAIVAIAEDARSEFGIRLGRFPDRGFGTLRLNAFVDSGSYSVSDGHLELGADAEATAVSEDRVTFAVTGPCEARFESEARNSAHMRGDVRARALTHETARIAVTGPNGSGKTSLLRALTGELEAAGGIIRRPAHLRFARAHQNPRWHTGALRQHLRREGVDETRFSPDPRCARRGARGVRA